MLEAKPWRPPDVVDQNELRAWRDRLNKPSARRCSPAVAEFIEALARKMPDFERIGEYVVPITGYELILSGQTHYEGERIMRWKVYPLTVPRMVAVDHRAAMVRAVTRRGRKGLENYIRARVKGKDVQRLLDILEHHVFDEGLQHK